MSKAHSIADHYRISIENICCLKRAGENFLALPIFVFNEIFYFCPTIFLVTRTKVYVRYERHLGADPPIICKNFAGNQKRGCGNHITPMRQRIGILIFILPSLLILW